MRSPELFSKYNVQAPRYTSYPTVPCWDTAGFDADAWRTQVKARFQARNQAEGISLYIHLPYCESLCTYCGCNTRITVNHAVEGPYVAAVLAEWDLYRAVFGTEKPRVRELHLGGGTPTFFSAAHLEMLITGILRHCTLLPDAELSLEGHPNHTTEQQLHTLARLGFQRISYGIQDFDPRVQEVVNRIQTVETVARATEAARRAGFSSVNFDLIYGLPFQTQESVRNTFAAVAAMRPDRIAFYSYAHVPWIKPGQRRFTEMDLPTGAEKHALYMLGRELLQAQGYAEIGMDHFALPGEGLETAAHRGSLHRNFMGYTPVQSALMIGLGVSAIGDAWTAFGQNLKTVETYLEAVNAGRLPLLRGHLLTQEDLILRQHILNLMCRGETSWAAPQDQTHWLSQVKPLLAEMIADGLVHVTENGMLILPEGKPFLRNACMALDARLAAVQPGAQIFSSAV